MNYRMIAYLLGVIVLIEAAFLLLPLAVALIDISVVGSINPSLSPALSALLVVLQIVVLGASGAMLRQDVVRARNKRARRLRRQEVARSREAFEQALGQRQNAPARRVCA